MSILFALILGINSPVGATKATREAAPTYPLRCKMKAVAGPIEARLDSTGKFSLVVEYQGQKFTCQLKPLAIKQTKDEPIEHGGQPESKWKTEIRFGSDLLCEPKDIPPSFTKNLNTKIDWILREKTMEFFIENGEPAAACPPLSYNKKQTQSILDGVKKKISPPTKN